LDAWTPIHVEASPDPDDAAIVGTVHSPLMLVTGLRGDNWYPPNPYCGAPIGTRGCEECFDEPLCPSESIDQTVDATTSRPKSRTKKVGILRRRIVTIVTRNAQRSVLERVEIPFTVEGSSGRTTSSSWTRSLSVVAHSP
jgi:hypothetical protein